MAGTMYMDDIIIFSTGRFFGNFTFVQSCILLYKLMVAKINNVNFAYINKKWLISTGTNFASFAKDI